MHLAPGLVIADKFRLTRLLGEGGMGAVWLATHTGLDVPCAVKFIQPEAAQSLEIRARFEREAKTAAQLKSPHVVQVIDHGEWHNVPYIAMEFLEGEDLSRRLKRRKPLPPSEVVAIISQVGRALTRAHAAGLVHRDLKPANIFLVPDDDREIAKVLDFGVVKTTAANSDDHTKTGALMGTPNYMSPEQARGSKHVDHRADLWSLGVVTYECLTGKRPFRGDVIGDVLAKIIADPLPVPSQIAPVPPGFDAWWARACARDPAERFQSAKEMTDALGAALGIGAAEAASAVRPSCPSDTPFPSSGRRETGTEIIPAPAAKRDTGTEIIPAPTAQTAPMAAPPLAPTVAEPAVPAPPPRRDAPASSSRTIGVAAIVIGAAAVAGYSALVRPSEPARREPIVAATSAPTAAPSASVTASATAVAASTSALAPRVPAGASPAPRAAHDAGATAAAPTRATADAPIAPDDPPPPSRETPGLTTPKRDLQGPKLPAKAPQDEPDP